MKVSASILAANHSNLREEIIKAENAGADLLHVDVMDGHFVPNIFSGTPILKSIRKFTKLRIDVHLMVQDPELYIDALIDAGADSITVHYESCLHIYRILEKIKQRGLGVGVAYNPATAIDSLEYIYDIVDKVLIMTVDPGFGSQKLRLPILNKIVKLKSMLKRQGSKILIEVDGGVGFDNLDMVADCGADIIVIGNKIFNSINPKGVIQRLKVPISLKSKAVIFDFDGVILDSEPFQHQAFNKILNENNQKPLTFDEFVPHIGKSTKEIWELIKGNMSHSQERLTLLKEQKYHEIVSSRSITPIQGVKDILSQLKKNEWSIGLASSSPKQTLLILLRKLGLLDYFSVVVSAEEVKRGKPYPDIYDFCAQKLGVDKKYILAIEDSENGVNSAANAEIKCIAIPNKYTLNQNFSNAEVILKSIEQLSYINCSELLYGVNLFKKENNFKHCLPRKEVF